MATREVLALNATTPQILAPQAGDTYYMPRVLEVSPGTAAAPAIVPTGDPNTGLWAPSADALAISTGGTERVRIGSDGIAVFALSITSSDVNSNRISFGTTTFTYNGSVVPNYGLGYSDNGGNYDLHIAGYTNIKLYTNQLERVRVTSDGNLGVGSVSFGTSAAKVLSLGTGTAPVSGPADTIQLYSSDLSADNTMLSLYTEGTCVSANTGTTNLASRIAVRINGTVYYLLAASAP